ncbi:hypothetical protein CSB37_02515 [bacterium DOLZORAL124_38_8]|nr:MAG: hypothetical protein CSB37_02515 [bacterium DOLZORAL124_38_8]
MKQAQCTLSGETFQASDLEQSLRQKFDLSDNPTTAPWVRFRELGAFWQHWNLHNRVCDLSGEKIISVFNEQCPYPIWHKDLWIKENNPPTASYDFSRSFFEQAWELFQQCPLPHTFQSKNENCDYTDDFYNSKNCYLCHSGQNNEDLMYSYGCDSAKDLCYSGRAFRSELGVDIINSHHCFDSLYLLSCWNISNSAFLYDCRNCSDCLFCFNLRNKQYCFGNQQLTKTEFEAKKEQWDLSSRAVYDKAKYFFADMMIHKAWHKFQDIEHYENASGSYISHVKNCENCHLLTHHEDCVNVAFSGPKARLCLDSIGTVGAELAYQCVLPVYSYFVRFCSAVNNCKFCDYSMFLQNCEHCFGCCGLFGKKYCIFNKQYSPTEYETIRQKIIDQMKKNNEWGKFFPGKFAPNSYEESWSSFYWPLSQTEQQKLGFRTLHKSPRNHENHLDITNIPDSVTNLTDEDEASLRQQSFWDKEYQRPFKILGADIKFARKMNCPLPNCFYMNRIQENFGWLFFNGKLTPSHCAKCQKSIQTNLPAKYHQRILCEDCYLAIL